MAKSQCEQILEHLKAGYAITPIDAFREFKSMRLAARIRDLKEQGHDIITTMITEPSGKRHAYYHLKGT